MADAKKTKTPIIITPKGTAKYPHLLKADDKYNKAEPKFHTKLVFDGADPEFLAFREKCEKVIADAIEEYKAGEGKKFAKRLTTKYSLFREVFDEEGEATGQVEIKVTAKASFKNKQTGKITANKLDIRDTRNAKASPAAIYGGSILKLAIRPGITAQGAEITEYAHLFGVQIITLATGNGGGYSFGQEEGDYEAEDGEEGSAFSDESESDGEDAEPNEGEEEF